LNQCSNVVWGPAYRIIGTYIQVKGCPYSGTGDPILGMAWTKTRERGETQYFCPNIGDFWTNEECFRTALRSD